MEMMNDGLWKKEFMWSERDLVYKYVCMGAYASERECVWERERERERKVVGGKKNEIDNNLCVETCCDGKNIELIDYTYTKYLTKNQYLGFSFF